MPGRIRLRLTVLPLLGLLAAAPVPAEVLRIEPGTVTVVTKESLPVRGEEQQRVLLRHGEPRQRFATVGGGSAQQPPITRWDYDGFSVVFEGSLVLHSVVHGPTTPQPR
jgi:hypothetical protein